MATNYYSKLDGSSFGVGGQGSNFQSGKKSERDVYIGGVNFGNNWNDMDAAALQHMQLQASIDQQLEERAYNTPAAQAQRMRAAGLNPDMQNIDNGNGSISAGVGSPSGESADAQKDRRINTISSTVQSMVQLLPQAIQIVQSMQTHSVDMFQKELSMLQGADQLAFDRVVSMTPLSAYTEGKSPDSNGLWTFDIKNKRLRKMVHLAGAKYYDGNPQVKAAVLKRYSDALDSEFGYQLNNARDVWSDSDKLFVDVLRDLWKFEYQSQVNEKKFKSNYYGNLDGKTFAESDTAIKKNSSLDDVDKEFSDYISKMWKSDDKWDNLKAAVLFLLTKLSGGFSVGPNGTTKTIGF